MLRRFERCSRQSCFSGESVEDFQYWQRGTRVLLAGLLGLEKIESCPLNAIHRESVTLPEGIRREHWTIETEPGVMMPFYLMIPPDADRTTRIFLCPPGHGGAGKYSVAGASEYSAVKERIDFYNYDYGLQLARLGYVALCPDCRGFGERRENRASTVSLPYALKGDCALLARMGLPLGITVIGMFVHDLKRAVDYLAMRGDWAYTEPNCLGFSGGGRPHDDGDPGRPPDGVKQISQRRRRHPFSPRICFRDGRTRRSQKASRRSRSPNPPR